MKKKFGLYIFILLLFCGFSFLDAVEIKQLKEFTLSQEESIIARANSFVVTEDQNIILVDAKAADIKIFDMNGKRLSVFGRKGVGPNEFIRPRRIMYHEPFVAFVDFGGKCVFVYKRTQGNHFQFVKKFLCLDLGDDFKMIENGNVLISGHKIDKNKRKYHFYRYDFKKKETEFILPSEVAYNCRSIQEYQKKNDVEFLYNGSNIYFGETSDYIYFVWTGDMNIGKYDRKTKKISRFGQGKRKTYFIKPFFTSEIKGAFFKRDFKYLYKLQYNMSYIRDLFVTRSGNVGVVYVGPLEKDKPLHIMIQFYSRSGEFLTELDALETKASHHFELYFHFNRDQNRFYVLDTETTDDFDQLHRMHELQITE